MIEQKKNRLIKFYLLAVIILLIFLHYLGALAVIEDYFIATAAEAQNQTYIFLTKLKYSFINYQEAQVLKKDNITLKHQIDELLYQNNQLTAYKTENEQLRALLNFKEDKDYDLLLAKVMGKDINRSNTLIINKGKSNGIKEGYPAVIDQGIIIGKVIEVKDNLSTILLITDKLSSLAVSTIASNKTNGLAKGEYGLSIKVELIPQDLPMQENDLIVTSGQEKDIPRGLILGKINRIISHENELFKSATISPLIDFEEISILSILLPKQY